MVVQLEKEMKVCLWFHVSAAQKKAPGNNSLVQFSTLQPWGGRAAAGKAARHPHRFVPTVYVEVVSEETTHFFILLFKHLYFLKNQNLVKEDEHHSHQSF